MEVVAVLLGASLIVAVGFLVAFVWAVRNGQYEDTYTPSLRMLLDDRGASTHSDSDHGEKTNDG